MENTKTVKELIQQTAGDMGKIGMSAELMLRIGPEASQMIMDQILIPIVMGIDKLNMCVKAMEQQEALAEAMESGDAEAEAEPEAADDGQDQEE